MQPYCYVAAPCLTVVKSVVLFYISYMFLVNVSSLR